jgi:hypothetical protein
VKVDREKGDVQDIVCNKRKKGEETGRLKNRPFWRKEEKVQKGRREMEKLTPSIPIVSLHYFCTAE